MAAPSDLETGPELEYLKKLASGPLGPVWLARIVTGQEAGRLVTARCLSLVQFDQSELERVVSVSRAFARVAHPCLAKGLGAHCAQSQLIILGEHVAGVPLTALRRAVFAEAASIPLPVAVRIIGDVVRGACELRRECSLSGPFVPDRFVFADTILVASFGETLLSAAGVASELYHCRDIRDLPELGELLSPEEILSTDPPGEKAEVFTLGVLLWELLVGRRLFGGGDCRQTLDAVLYAPVPAVDAAFQADLSIIEPVAEIVRRATSRDEWRYASLRELREALEALPPEALASDADVQRVIQSIAGDYLTDSEWCGGLTSVRLSSNARASTQATDLSSVGHAPLPECYLPWEPATLAGRRHPSGTTGVPLQVVASPDADPPPGSAPATAVTSGLTGGPRRRRAGTIALLVGAALVLVGVGGLSLLRSTAKLAGPTVSVPASSSPPSQVAEANPPSRSSASRFEPETSPPGPEPEPEQSTESGDRARTNGPSSPDLGPDERCESPEPATDAGCPRKISKERKVSARRAPRPAPRSTGKTPPAVKPDAVESSSQRWGI